MEERKHITGYECGAYPFLDYQEKFLTEDEEIEKFLEKNTVKMAYSRLKRTDAVLRYGKYRKITYAEALDRLKNSYIFKKGSFLGGIMWKDKIEDPEEIRKCERRRENTARCMKKNCLEECEEEEEEEEDEENPLFSKIKEKIKNLDLKIPELRKKIIEERLELETSIALKKELENLL